MTAGKGKSPRGRHIAVGDKVPDFEVTIDGKKWKFSELQKNATMTDQVIPPLGEELVR